MWSNENFILAPIEIQRARRRLLISSIFVLSIFICIISQIISFPFQDKNNQLHTPIPDSFLDGITRKTVIDLAKSKNIKVNERKISTEELSSFKGCFITGTAAEITPVGNITDNNFEVCDLIKDLSTSYEKLVGKN